MPVVFSTDIEISKMFITQITRKPKARVERVRGFVFTVAVRFSIDFLKKNRGLSSVTRFT
jgi:hypothetical protein